MNGGTTELRVVLFALALFTASCSTPYQPQGFRGGYSDIRIDSNTVDVAFRGNGYTGKQRVRTYLLYRCAEVTRQDGYDFFVMVDKDIETRTGQFTTSGTYTASTTASAYGAGNMAFGSSTTRGTYTPGETITYTKYGADTTIKMFKGQRPSGAYNVYDAGEVLRHLGPQLGLGDGKPPRTDPPGI
jgi:hypothetical protein